MSKRSKDVAAWLRAQARGPIVEPPCAADVDVDQLHHPAPSPAAIAAVDPHGALRLMFRIATNRYGLYLQFGGYAETPAGPFASAEEIHQLVLLDYVRLDPDGGAHGSAKITRRGQEVLVEAGLIQVRKAG